MALAPQSGNMQQRTDPGVNPENGWRPKTGDVYMSFCYYIPEQDELIQGEWADSPRQDDFQKL